MTNQELHSGRVDLFQGETPHPGKFEGRPFGYVRGVDGGYFFAWLDTLDATIDSIEEDEVDGDGGLNERDVARFLREYLPTTARGKALWKWQDIIDVLTPHGPRFTGSNARNTAESWADYNFDADEVSKWCEIGVWDPGTATTFQQADITPSRVRELAELVAEEMGDDSIDVIYAICNGDMEPDVIIKVDSAP